MQTYHAHNENQEKHRKHFTACGNIQHAFAFPREQSVGSRDLCRPFAGSSTRMETLIIVPNVAKIARSQCASFLLSLPPSSLGLLQHKALLYVEGQENPSSPDHLTKVLSSPLYVSAEGNASPRIPQMRSGSLFYSVRAQCCPSPPVLSKWSIPLQVSQNFNN